MIQTVHIADVPRRRGRTSPLTPVVHLVRALPPGQSLKVDALDLADAMRIQKALDGMLRYHGIRARFRTNDDAPYIWRVGGESEGRK